jgi:uncharacterized protein (TIGR03546 family)
MIRQLAKLIRILNSETNPVQISLAICFGMIVGFTQISSAHNLIILFIVLFLRVNLPAFILGTLTFKSLSLLFTSIFHKVGLWFLTADFFNGIATLLYNTTFWKFDRFNNTVISGGIVVSIIGFLPMLFLCNYLIKKYRSNILAYVQKTKIAKAMLSTDFYHYYKKYTRLKDAL